MANYTADQLTQATDPNQLAIAGAPFGGGNSQFLVCQQIVSGGLQAGGGIPAVSTTGAGYSVWVGAQSAGGSSGAGGDYNILLAAQNTSGGNGSFKIWDTTGATNVFKVDNAGIVTASSNIYCGGILYLNDSSSGIQVGAGFTVISYTGTQRLGCNATVVGAFGVPFGISSGWSNAPDVLLDRDAADTFAQRRTTNAQTFRIYNTYTDASNYERGYFYWTSNVFEIGTEGAGTGGLDRTLRITRGANSRLELSNTSGSILKYGASNSITVGNSITLTTNSALNLNGATMGFYGVSAVARPATGGASSTIVSGSGTAGKQDDTYDGYTLAQVVKALRNLGILT